MSTTSTTETRVMRTYRVDLTSDSGLIASADVNLSFPLGDDGTDPEFLGHPVTDIKAWAELNSRLRKLAGRKRIPFSPAQLADESIERSATIVRSRLVEVAIDPTTGNPIPARKGVRS